MDINILQLPAVPAARSREGPDELSRVLFETAGLLAESRHSSDARFRDEVIDLAVRSLQVAGTVIERRLETPGRLPSPRSSHPTKSSISAVPAKPASRGGSRGTR